MLHDDAEDATTAAAVPAGMNEHGKVMVLVVLGLLLLVMIMMMLVMMILR